METISQSSAYELSSHKIILLEKFLNKFLPPGDNKRKYTHNEFSFLYKTLQKIFSQYCKAELSELELLTCLSENGYSLYIARNKMGNYEKDRETKSIGKSKSMISEELNAFIYVGISSRLILQIKRASQSLALQNKPSKAEQLVLLKEKITALFDSNLPP